MSAFSTSAVLTTPTAHALQAALSILTNNGFAIVSRDENSASLTGPGLNSTRQNPLLGASKIHLIQDGDRLRVDAELDAAERFQRFLSSIPWCAGLGAALLHASLGLQFGWKFGVGFGVPGSSGWSWLLMSLGIGLLSGGPWFVFSPWMSGMIRANTEQALKNLVTNAVHLSKYQSKHLHQSG